MEVFADPAVILLAAKLILFRSPWVGEVDIRKSSKGPRHLPLRHSTQKMNLSWKPYSICRGDQQGSAQFTSKWTSATEEGGNVGNCTTERWRVRRQFMDALCR